MQHVLDIALQADTERTYIFGSDQVDLIVVGIIAHLISIQYKASAITSAETTNFLHTAARHTFIYDGANYAVVKLYNAVAHLHHDVAGAGDFGYRVDDVGAVETVGQSVLEGCQVEPVQFVADAEREYLVVGFDVQVVLGGGVVGLGEYLGAEGVVGDWVDFQHGCKE